MSRTLVQEDEPYLLPTSSLTGGKGFVTAFIKRQALGAGGCCTGRPEYRSTDGLTWNPH